MTDSAAAAAATYDHHSPAYAQGWRELHDALRSACPLARSEVYGGFYVLTRYDDVEAAIKDDATFSSYHDLTPGSPYGGIIIPNVPNVSTPIEMDPPEYGAYRKLLNPFFSPAAAARWEPWLRDVATALIDGFIGSGRADLVREFASPLPALFTAEFLGLPLDDWRLYSDASHAFVSVPPDSAAFAAVLESWGAILDRALATARRRREEPADDFLTALVTREVNGALLDDRRILEVCSLIIGGGNDTTTGLFANALHWLAAHPQERAWLAEDPARLGPATEEFLRYFTPTQALARTVTRDVEFAGRAMRAGDRVLLFFAAANFDPEAFDEPHELRLDRFPNRHQAFGLGIHRCSGSSFARTEFVVGMSELLRRLGEFEVDEAASARYPRVGTVNGWDRLVCSFAPGPELGSEIRL